MNDVARVLDGLMATHPVNDEDRQERVEQLFRQLIIELGLYKKERHSNQLDLKNTPQRVARMWLNELLGGYTQIEELEKSFTTFEADEDMDKRGDLVVVRDIPFASMCGHHFLPFMGYAHVGYLPNGKYAGLSKLARVVEGFARRVQTQERMTSQVADFLAKNLEAVGVHVITCSEHLCMNIRGAKKPGSKTVLAALRGKCNDPAVKSEFQALLGI